jgi:hypothetical protein
MQKANGKDMSTVKIYVDEYLEQNAQEQVRKRKSSKAMDKIKKPKRVMTKCITTSFNSNPTPPAFTSPPPSWAQ